MTIQEIISTKEHTGEESEDPGKRDSTEHFQSPDRNEMVYMKSFFRDCECSRKISAVVSIGGGHGLET